MTNYEPVVNALAQGVEPAMLCATCPWDRNCVNPPEMSTADVHQKVNEAAEIARTTGGDVATASLMAVVVYAGRDTALQACPVLGIRLRSAEGRKAAEAVRTLMQSWEES